LSGDLLWMAAGLVVLVVAGDLLVRGAVNLGLRLGIPALIISLTIVAFGTSAPELLVSIAAVLEGAPGIAMGNVVGSNIANVLMVLGIPALMAGLATEACDTRRSYVFMLSATVLFIILCFLAPIRWPHALILLGGLGLMIGDAARRAMSARRALATDDLEGADPGLPAWRIAAYLIVGLIGLPLGADILVQSASNIARAAGISETVIGLTLVAIGTSLPELATTVMAALQKRADVVLGNVIGSNMFNLLGIIGVAGLVGPLPVNGTLLSQDLWMMLGVSLLLWPFVYRGWPLTRLWGAGMTAAYGLYVMTLLH
jgi:cation:H+ antiporter